MIEGKKKLAKINSNPDFKFNELKGSAHGSEVAPKMEDGNFLEILSHAASNIASLSRENKDHVVGTLKMVDAYNSDYWKHIDSKTLI